MNRFKALWMASRIGTFHFLLPAACFRFLRPSSLWLPFFCLTVLGGTVAFLTSDLRGSGRIRRKTAAQAGGLPVVGISLLLHVR